MTKQITEDEAIDFYNCMLDEIVPIANGMPYSRLLEAGDPIAYNCGLTDYIDSISDEYEVEGY